MDEAQKAYQTLVITLFKNIDEVASSNPKYEHIVRLENYHFFRATVGPLRVSKLGYCPCLGCKVQCGVRVLFFSSGEHGLLPEWCCSCCAPVGLVVPEGVTIAFQG